MSTLSELRDTQAKICEAIRFLEHQDTSAPMSSVATEKGCGQNVAVRGTSAEEIISNLFTYHSPNPDTTQRYETIRDAAKHLALVIWKNCPYGQDRTVAIRKLREAVMTANASIALNGRYTRIK